MGFIDDKSNLFGEIAVIRSIEENFPELNKAQSSFNSVKSKSGNLIPFMLDLLKELAGNEVKESFNRILLKVTAIEKDMKEEIIRSLTENGNFSLSAATQNVTSQPILKTDIKNIDLQGTLKINPNEGLGKNYYGKDTLSQSQTFTAATNNSYSVNASAPPSDFSRFLYNIKESGSGNWRDLLLFTYDKDVPVGNNGTAFTDTLTVYLSNTLNGRKLDSFLREFLDSITMLDLSLVVSTILDILFGAVSSLTDAGYEWLNNQLKINKTVDKIINKESLANEDEPIIYDNSFFDFSKSELDEIDRKLDGIVNGVNLVDLGCGFGENFIDLDDMEDSINRLNDIRPSYVKSSLTEFTNKLIKNSTVGVSEDNRITVETNIISEILNALPGLLYGFTMKPSNILLYQIAESLINGGINEPQIDGIYSGVSFEVENGNNSTKSSTDVFMQKFKKPVSCMVKKIYSIILKILFELVKAEILKRVPILFKKIAEDQRDNYLAVSKTSKDLLKNVTNLLSFINSLK